MGDLGQIANVTDKVTSEFTRKAMNAFTLHYNQRKDEYFSQAHGFSSTAEYNKHDYTRVAFKSKSEIELFMQDMQSQGISAVGMPFQLNGQYIAEIPAQYEDGRTASEIIDDFQARSYTKAQSENLSAYERVPQNVDVGSDIADALVVNHLDSLGATIHKVQQLSDFFGVGQYGQTSNDDIFNSGLNAQGAADPYINSGNSKVATVINGDTVIIDGKRVTDENIVNNVLSQHHERIAQAQDILSTIDGRMSHQEQAQLSSATNYVNKQADIIAKYEKYMQNGESLSQSQLEEYEKAQQVVSEISNDMGRAIDAEHHVTKNEMLDFNRTMLQKVEEAGIGISRPNSGVFDTNAWQRIDGETFSDIGISASTQSLIYNINAEAKQLSLQQLNAEAILNGIYRQDYAVSTSSKDTQTAKIPEDTLFGAWTLGALEDISNKLNTETISKETIAESKLKEHFTDTEAELIQSAISTHNDSIKQSAIEDAIQSVFPSLSVSLDEKISSGASPVEFAFTTSDTLDTIGERYTTSRNGLIKHTFAENPNLEDILKKNNFTVEDIISTSPETARKLDLFIQGQVNTTDIAALKSLRTDISDLHKQEMAETNSFLVQSYNKARAETVLDTIKTNPELSNILSTHNLSVEVLASATSQSKQQLSQLIDEYRGTDLFKPLVQMRDEIEKLNHTESKALENYSVEKPLEVTSYTDLLDNEKSSALVAAKFTAEREMFISSVFGGNLELAQVLAKNGISINDLATNASGTADKLNKIIANTKDVTLSKSLIDLKTNLSMNYSAEERIKKELAEKISGNIEERSISLASMVDKNNHSLSVVSESIDSIRLEQFFSTRKNLAALLAKEGVNIKGLSSEEIAAKITELRNKKTIAALNGNTSLALKREIELLSSAEADFEKIIADEKKFSKKLSSVFELSPFEQNILTGNNKLWNDLQNVSWLKGKGLVDGFMTPEKLLGINAEFLKRANQLGYKFVGITGFNLEYLQKLSAKDLEALGITANIRNSLVEINRKGAFGKHNNLKSMFIAAQKGMAFIIKNVDGNAEGWQDVQEFTGNLQKGVKYTQSAITNIRRLQNIRPQDLNVFRKGGAKNLIEQWNKPLQPKKKPIKPAEGVTAKPLSAKQMARQEKYAANLQSKLVKTQAQQNTLFAKMNAQMAAVKKKIAESAVGKALQAVQTAVSGAISTLLIYYFAVAAVLALVVQVVAIVAVLVVCLVDTVTAAFDIGNWFAVRTYKDTVAWALYEDLLTEENRYVAELASTPEYAYDLRNSISYGFSGKTLEEYLEDFKTPEGYSRLLYVTDNGGDVRINPFWREGYVTADSNEGYLTVIDSFDGNHTYDITTNLNYYNMIDNPEAEKYDPVYGISNGHTSNIKDIMAMTDIMYQMEATENDDGTLHSILGMNPHRLNWDNFWGSLGRGIKTIGDFFANLCATIFTGAEWIPPHNDINGLSYDTVRTYAINLFEVSHQQSLYLSVDYCDKNRKIYDYNGQNINFELGTEMEYGICANPVTNNFKVKLDTSKNPDSPEPYVERDDGSIQFLDKKNPDGTPWFDISVSVEENLLPTEERHICLWDDMPTEHDVYKGHTYCVTDDRVWNRIKSSAVYCWTQKEVETSYEYISAYGSATSTDITTAQNACKSLIQARLRALLETKLANKEENFYIITEDVAIAYEYTYVSSISNAAIQYDGWGRTVRRQDGVTYYTFTNIGKHKLYTLKITTYVRECRGHYFEYCGGHVSTHEQGNVFSVTNEQLAISNIYEEGQEPVALSTHFADAAGVYHNEPYTRSLYYGSYAGDFEIKKRYEQLLGKVEKKNVDYSTALSASTTGGCVSPLIDLYQGSSVSQGLNIVVAADGTWGADIEIRGGMVRYCRDIFDCDCIIKKGCNVFPYTDYTKYEGWTADNMSLAINRIAMNWYELYGFEVATEIGECNYSLSEQDIEMLLVGLEAEYGTDFTDDRKEITKAILSYVGRGHYTMHHHPFEHSTSYTSDQLDNANHGFLSYLCTSCNGIDVNSGGYIYKKYHQASCSAGNEVDIGNFVLNYIGKKFGRNIGGCYSEIEGYQGVTYLLPADIVTHSEYNLARNGYRLNVVIGSGVINGELLNDFYLKQQAVMYVGNFSDTSIQAMKDYLKSKLDADAYNEYATYGLKLSTGQKIISGIPVCVDLNQMGVYSGLRLRTEGSRSASLSDYLSNYYTGGENATDINSANAALQTTYYWLIHPDSRTHSYKAESLINPSW